MRAEDALQSVCTLDAVSSYWTALLERTARARIGGAGKSGLLGLFPSIGAVASWGIPRASHIPFGVSGASLDHPATGHNRLVLEREPTWSSLYSLARFEALLESPAEVPVDWGMVAMGFGPIFEHALHDPLMEVGARLWRGNSGYSNRFFSPMLEEAFEKGRKPTFSTFEAIIHLVSTVDALQLDPHWRPLSSTYLPFPSLVRAFGLYREERNRLCHQGRRPWNNEDYQRHCRSLFGARSFQSWLAMNFERDESGRLTGTGTAGAPTNLLGALLVQRHLCRVLPKTSTKAALRWIKHGVLQASDFPDEWRDRAASQATLEDADALVRAGLAEPERFGTAWRTPLLDATTIERALEIVTKGLASPEDFTDPWRQRQWQSAGWKDALRLVEVGLVPRDWLLAEAPDRTRWRMTLHDALEAVADGTPPSSFEPAWREREITRAGWSERKALVDAGLATAADFDESWLAPRLAGLTSYQIRDLLLCGLVSRQEISRKWIEDRAAFSPPRVLCALKSVDLLDREDIPAERRRALAFETPLPLLRELLSSGLFTSEDVDRVDLVRRRTELSLDDLLWFTGQGAISANDLPPRWGARFVKKASRLQAAQLVRLGLATVDDFPVRWRASLSADTGRNPH